jgi:hypothetical protein
MEKVLMNGKMAKYIKVISKTENLMELVKFIIQMEKSYKEYGKMEKTFKLQTLFKKKQSK